MSKVKCTLNSRMSAKKAHRSLRIADTKQKKNNRINNCKNGVYGYGPGYWITKNMQYEYEYVDVPEQVIPAKRVFESYYPERVIPAHKRKVVKNIITLDDTARPVKMDFSKSKKYHRKQAARKTRRYNGDLNHCDYKKLYDLWWQVL